MQSESTSTSEQFNRFPYPLIVGEVLFDHFPEEKKLGGAPFNVAWNLKGFGLDPLLATRIGDDAEGKDIRDRIHSWQMDASAVQTDGNRPTGRVEITVDHGEPSYKIVSNQAYDSIDTVKLIESLGERRAPAIFYHGSLAWRDGSSRAKLAALRNSIGSRIFVDINVREPWFDIAWLQQLITNSEWLKLNIDELALISGQSCESRSQIVAAAVDVLRRFQCQHCWVTAGADGAYSIDAAGNDFFAAAPHVEKIVNTVGAGDGFASVVIYGILNDWPPQRILDTAVEFAATVCTLAGALSDDPQFYREAIAN